MTNKLNKQENIKKLMHITNNAGTIKHYLNLITDSESVYIDSYNAKNKEFIIKLKFVYYLDDSTIENIDFISIKRKSIHKFLDEKSILQYLEKCNSAIRYFIHTFNNDFTFQYG